MKGDGGVTIQAPAKVNLVLRVLGRRPDGYHELETLFERIGLCDELQLRRLPARPMSRQAGLGGRRPAITLASAGFPVPKGRANLAVRAAELMLRERTRRRPQDRSRLLIRLTKRIPVGAGLGGGSSDAAAALLGLNRLWGLGLSRRRLLDLAAQLGSDVPFFVLETRFAIGRGRGERLEPVAGPRLWHLVVWPRVKRLSTQEVYEAWDQQHGYTTGHQSPALLRFFEAPKERRRVTSHQKGQESAGILEGLTRPRPAIKMILTSLHHPGQPALDGLLTNELGSCAVRLLPEIQVISQGLACSGLQLVTMSGSGPAVVGIAERRDAVTDAARYLARWDACLPPRARGRQACLPVQCRGRQAAWDWAVVATH